MSFFSLLAALLLEHFRPMAAPHAVFSKYSEYAGKLEHHINGGRPEHGLMAWTLALLPILFAVGLVHAFLADLGSLLAWGWNVAVLHFVMGFKYFSNTNDAIAEALRAGDTDRARQILSGWWYGDTADLSDDELARLSIEQVFISSHRQMFGVMFWFVLLSPLGPVGAVLYRLSSLLRYRWNEVEGTGVFGQFAEQVFRVLDWPASRATALSYAVVGNFEDALNCWRDQAMDFGENGIVVASGAGALGVRVGGPIHCENDVSYRPEVGIGESAGPDFMEGAVSMVWRAVVLWLALLLLVLIASWVG
jgi:adenosylcobinamide-phosphate synthase